MSESAALTCSKCGSSVSEEPPGSVPSPETSAGVRSQGAYTTRLATISVASESAHVEDGPAPGEPDQHGLTSFRVVFRDDGSAVLEYAQAPVEALDGESTATEPTTLNSVASFVEPAVEAVRLQVPDLVNEQPLASAQPPRIQWSAARAGARPMTAFAMGAATAAFVLVCGYFAYRSVAASGAPSLVREPPVAAAFDGPVNDRVAPRIPAAVDAEPARAARPRPKKAAASVGDSASARPRRVAPSRATTVAGP